MLIYGFWMARIASILCATSAVITLFLNILILELSYVSIMRMLFIKRKEDEPLITTTRDVDVCYVAAKAEIQRDTLYTQFGEKILRRPFVKEYEPLNGDEIKVVQLNLKVFSEISFYRNGKSKKHCNPISTI